MNRSSEPVQRAAQALLQGLNRRQTALANGPGCRLTLDSLFASF